MPIDPTTDPDFMNAAPSDQMKYLTSVDSDFAQASPQDQLGYLMHVRGIPSGVSGPAAPQVDVKASEGPIAQGLTSFETQLSKTPGAVLGFLKNAAQGFPEDTAEHARVLAGQESPLTETGHALQKINPIVSNSEGIDYGATAANLLPLLMSAKSAPEGTLRQLGQVGLETGKTAVKLGDVATFNRASEIMNAIKQGASNIRTIRNPPVYPGAPLPERPPIYPGAKFPEHPGYFPGAHLPENPGTFPGAPYPEHPGVFPGAPYPAVPPPELTQAGALARGVRLVTSPADALSGIKVATPVPTTPEGIAAARYQDVPLTGAKAPAVQGVDPYSLPRTPPMETAQSTTIAQHGYHGDSQTMVVQFKNGKVYEYKGVPQKVYNQYQQSESQGSFFSNNIKGRYQTSLRGSVKPSPGQQAASALGR